MKLSGVDWHLEVHDTESIRLEPNQQFNEKSASIPNETVKKKRPTRWIARLKEMDA